MKNYSPSKFFRISSSVFVALYIAFATITFSACSNSETVGVNVDESAKFNFKDTDTDISPTQEDTSVENDSTRADSIITEPANIDSICFPEVVCDSISEDLPLDDTEYPYAGIPRIVIETENHQAIKDRETEIPAKLQIWGANAPESDIMVLTIRGRGNTSWVMPKKSYKIEFVNKQSMLGMPKDRDWALIGNYADKTLMKNYLMYHLSAKLGAYYAPRCEFAELFLNGSYLGVYLLTETIKIAKNRINIPNSDKSYIVEIDGKYRENENVVFSKIISNDSVGKAFRIHSPKNATTEVLSVIEKHITDFEIYLKKIDSRIDNQLEQWLDIDEYMKHYWVQEFSKNPDAAFCTSVFFCWEKDGLIKAGPVWDFDLAFGSHINETTNQTDKWHLKTRYWNLYVFKDSLMEDARKKYWKNNRDKFVQVIDEIDFIVLTLKDAAENNFKKWKILQSTSYLFHRNAYNSYLESVEDLKMWIKERIDWIDGEMD